jgi:hypothetical protein
MKKRYTLIGSLILLVLLGVGALWSMSRSVAHANPPVIASEANNPLVAINEKARAARNGDVNATRELVDEMFRMFDFAQEFAELDDTIKERLVRAQLNHSSKHSKSSCSEARVVHAVNLLADKLGTPAYTRTNAFEVRRLRANLLLHTPEIQGPRFKSDLRKGQKQSIAMSPIETFYLAVTLIQQKRHNPEYQLTNNEWISLHGGKRSSAAIKQFNEEMQRRRNDSKRTDEVLQAVNAGISRLNPFDMFRLPDDLMTTLGIER